MHKQGAKLARAATIRPGDKIKVGGRGPWPRITDVQVLTDFEHGRFVRIQTTRTLVSLDPDEFVRVIRDA